MNILYVAKHGPYDNQDEDAISHVLRSLGHRVAAVREREADRRNTWTREPFDLLLFHKWYDFALIEDVRARVKAFWHFDLVTSDDWELVDRNAERVQWMSRVTPLVDLGFCTDGDWVDADKTGKLRWLTQGMDERVAGFGKRDGRRPMIDVLFVGSQIHGGKRISHLQELRERYGPSFVQLGHRPRDRVHGRALADVYANARVVVAPDGPCSHRYWSNRVYNTLGLGGFLLHPNCDGLVKQYTPGTELVMYHDRRDLVDLIDHFLKADDERERLRVAGHYATMRSHTYAHRVRSLLCSVGEVLSGK